MVNEQSVKEAFLKIKEEIELIKTEIQDLNKMIYNLSNYEDSLEVKKWNVLLVDGKRKDRWDGSGNVREWEKRREREKQILLNLFIFLKYFSRI